MSQETSQSPAPTEGGDNFFGYARKYWPWIVAGVFVIAIILASFCVLSQRKPAQGSVTFQMKQLFAEDKDGGISYPVLTGGAPEPVLESINAQIYKAIVGNSCWGDPRDPAAPSELQDAYSGELEALDGKTQDGKVVATSTVAGWSYKSAREHLRDDFGWYETMLLSTSSSDIYTSNDLFSIGVGDESYCGGAHPNYNLYGLTFDLTNGQEIPFSDLFTNWERDKQAIGDAVYGYAKSALPTEADDDLCDYAKGWKEGSLNIEDIEYTLTDRGFELLSFGYPHVAAGCEPAGQVTVPFSLLHQYLKPQFQALDMDATSAPVSIHATFAGSWER